MRKFDRVRASRKLLRERIGLCIENKGSVEVQEQERECKSEIFY